MGHGVHIFGLAGYIASVIAAQLHLLYPESTYREYKNTHGCVKTLFKNPSDGSDLAQEQWLRFLYGFFSTDPLGLRILRCDYGFPEHQIGWILSQAFLPSTACATTVKCSRSLGLLSKQGHLRQPSQQPVHPILPTATLLKKSNRA